MKANFIRFFAMLTLTLATSTFHLAARAAPVAQADADKVRGVIVTQLAALAKDDADGAFQMATPAVRQAIGNPLRFLAMVRGSYPMVYRPSSVSFHKPQSDDGTVLQMVEITDGEDKSWIALFTLEQQPDETWRISSCIVAENQWTSI